MNSLNYGSREACEKLVKAGIVLETEFYWCDNLGWVTLRPKEDVPIESCDWKIYPAPSMAEVWMELPDTFNGADIEIWKVANYTYCSYCDGNLQLTEHSISNTNPTDALIYLRIWLEERKEESHEPTI